METVCFAPLHLLFINTLTVPTTEVCFFFVLHAVEQTDPIKMAAVISLIKRVKYWKLKR